MTEPRSLDFWHKWKLLDSGAPTHFYTLFGLRFAHSSVSRELSNMDQMLQGRFIPEGLE